LAERLWDVFPLLAFPPADFPPEDILSGLVGWVDLKTADALVWLVEKGGVVSGVEA
jgi:hypothetical protein